MVPGSSTREIHGARKHVTPAQTQNFWQTATRQEVMGHITQHCRRELTRTLSNSKALFQSPVWPSLTRHSVNARRKVEAALDCLPIRLPPAFPPIFTEMHPISSRQR